MVEVLCDVSGDGLHSGQAVPGSGRGDNKNPTEERGVPPVGWVGVPGGGGVGCVRGGIAQKKYI